MNAGKLLAIGAALAAILVVSVSIWLNPPSENRARAMDQERERRLSSISMAISTYFTSHNALPGNLEVLDTEKHQLFLADWHDPETGQPFEYEITGEKSYRVCANFERSTDEWKTYYYRKHKVGRDCFEYKVK